MCTEAGLAHLKNLVDLETLAFVANGLRGWKYDKDGPPLSDVLEARVWKHIADERRARGMETGTAVESAIRELSKAHAEILRKQAAALMADARKLMARANALIEKASALEADADR